ncbi:MAG: VWA domain-containing protein [Acidobacteriaceae bacterium]|nr:VWA domain-containing protein [Acidobacteriaceae bacterium]
MNLRQRLIVVGCMALGLGVYAHAQSTPPPVNVDRDPVAAPEGDAPIAPPAITGAQGTVSRTGSGQFVLRRDAAEVVLNATVVDANQHLVENLDKSAFHVYEDGVPQTIVGFRHEDIPISLGILIDSSGSMYNKVEPVRTAAMDLIRASNKQDETFIVNFSDEAFIDQDLTSDTEKLSSALNRFRPAGGTAIYDAVVESADYLAQFAKKPKQVLLVITDGDDHDSTSSLESAIRRVQDMDGPVVYCIGLLFGSEDMDRASRKHSQRVLQDLADQTGGIAFFPRSVDDVDAITRQVAQDIRSQYTISYHSTRPYTEQGYRQIHVDAKAKGYPKLIVRTRSGYFPKKPGSATPAPENAPNLKGQTGK